MSDNLNSGSLLSSLSSSARPVRTATPMTTSGAGNDALPGTMSSAQRQAINREFLDNQTRQTNLLNSNAMLNNLAAQNQGMMNQFSGSLMRQMGAIDAAANKITNAINIQTNQLVSAITNMSSAITESIKGIQEGLNNMFYERNRAYASRLEYEENQNIYKEYSEKFMKTLFSERIMNLIASIEFVSLKEVKEQTLKYLMQNGGVAKFLGIRPLGSEKANPMVPFTRDIADAILDSARHLLVIANAVTNINKDTPTIIEQFGGAFINKQDILIDINTEILDTLINTANLIDAFRFSYNTVNRDAIDNTFRTSRDRARTLQEETNRIQTQGQLIQHIQDLRNQLAAERNVLEMYHERDDPDSNYNRSLADIRTRYEESNQRIARYQAQIAQLIGNQNANQQQIAQLRAELNTEQTNRETLGALHRQQLTIYGNLDQIGFTRGAQQTRMGQQNRHRTRRETEREIARIEDLIRQLQRGTISQEEFAALRASGFGVADANNTHRRLETTINRGLSSRFSNEPINRINHTIRQEKPTESMILTLKEAINKNAYQTEENTKALNKSISAMDIMKSTLLAAANPKNLWSIGQFGYKLFKFITPFFMYRWGLQMLTGKSPLPIIGQTLPGLISKPLNYISSIQMGDKTLGERASGWWETIKTTLAEFYNNHLKGIWEGIKDNLASFKETFIGWIGKDWWMRIYDTWEAVKKYTSLGWDAFLNPDVEKSKVAREQIVNSIKSAMKEVVTKYLIPGIAYSIGGYTVLKNIANPFGFISELARPFRYGMRRMAGGFRTNIYNFNEANEVLRNAALTQLRNANQYGLRNVTTNIRGGRFRLSARGFNRGTFQDYTDYLDQPRLRDAASIELAQRLDVHQSTAAGYIDDALRGKGFSYRMSRLVTSFGNGLRRVTTMLSLAAKGLSWAFNIGTTLFGIYKIWQYVKELYTKSNADGMFKSFKEFIFYSVEKGWNTLMDAGKEVWNQLPDIIGGLWDRAWLGLRRKWPTIWDNIKILAGKILDAGVNFLKNLGLSAWEWMKKKVGADDITLAIKEKYSVSEEKIKDDTKKKSEEIAKQNSALTEAVDFIRTTLTGMAASGKGEPLSVEERYKKAYAKMLDEKQGLKKETREVLQNFSEEFIINAARNVTNKNKIAYEGEDSSQANIAKKRIVKEDKMPIFQTLFGSSSFQNEEFEIKNGQIVQKAPTFSFNNLTDALNALIDDVKDNDEEALLALKNWLDASGKSNILLGSDIRGEIATIVNQFGWFGKEAIKDNVARFKDSEDMEEWLEDLERRYAANDLAAYKKINGGVKEVFISMAETISAEFKEANKESSARQRQELALELKKIDEKRAREEKLAEEAVRKANAEAQQKKEEKQQGLLDSVKSFFGFSEKSTGGSSLGVVAQWFQSGQFKKAIETAMGWIGDKIGGIIKFFKSQNYGKIFSDVMSGLGSASGAILSALYGADKADTFSRNAYNYAVKHNLKYAKAFFGGSRKSILMGVENIAEHAAKTGQTVKEIRDLLRSEGIPDKDQPASEVVTPYTGNKGLMIGTDNVTKGITADMFKDTKTGITKANTYDSDTSLRISLASTLFPNEGIRTNEHEARYPNTTYKYSYKKDFHSRMGLFALDLPSAAALVANNYGEPGIQIIKRMQTDDVLKGLFTEQKNSNGVIKYTAKSGGDILKMQNHADIIDHLNKVAHMTKDGKGMIDPNMWKDLLFKYIKSTRWKAFGFDVLDNSFIPAIYAEILDTAWWMGNGAARSVVRRAIRDTLNKDDKELAGKDIKTMLLENKTLLMAKQSKFLQNIFNAALGRANADWKKARIKRNMRTLGVPYTSGDYSLAVDTSHKSNYSGEGMSIVKDYEHGINSKNFSEKLNEFIQASGSARFNTAFSKILTKTGGDNSEYNRMLKIFNTDSGKALIKEVAKIEKKDPTTWSEQEAEIMAKFAGFFDRYDASAKKEGANNTAFYTTITTQNSYMTKLLEKYIGNDNNRRDAVNKRRQSIATGVS